MLNKTKYQYDYRQFFLDFNRTLNTIKDKTLLISSIISRIYELIPTKAVYAFWENNKTNHFQLINIEPGMSSDMFLAHDDGLVKWLRVNDTPLNVSFAPEFANIFSTNDAKIVKSLDAILVCPLKTNNGLMGAFMIQKRRDNKPYEKSELEMLSMLLDNVALAIENVVYSEERAIHLKHIYQADRLAVIGQMAAGAAHEIRNPLTSIKSVMQYIKNDLQEPRKQKMVETVLSEIDRINEILAGLLSFSRQNIPVKREFDLAALIDQTIDLIKNTRQQKQINFTTAYFAPSITIVADSDQLKQVFINIIINAIDAIDEEGNVEIDVCTSKFENEMFYTITVSDNGKGISEDVLEKLFDPFYTTKDNGTGLGLSISFGIIHRHRGMIDITNRSEGGAQVVIRLPQC